MKMNEKENELYVKIKGKLMRNESIEQDEFELLRKFNIYSSVMYEDNKLTLIVADVSGNLYSFRMRDNGDSVEYFEQPYKVLFKQNELGQIFVVPEVPN